jgi:hypothetical protein
MTQTEVLEKVEHKSKVDEGKSLVLYNDDVHTFDFVINS